MNDHSQDFFPERAKSGRAKSVECGGKPMELPASCRRLPHPHRGDLQGVGSPLASGEGIVSSFSVYASSNLLMLTLECIEEPVHC